MNPDYFNTRKWFYIGGDDQEHGPFSSLDMIRWIRCNFFSDTLQLRTIRDERFYPLRDWIRACDDQYPFHLPIESMRTLETENRINDQIDGLSVQSNGGYSLRGTPVSTPAPSLRPSDQQQQVIPVLVAQQRSLMNMLPAAPGMNPRLVPVSVPMQLPAIYQLVQQQQHPPVSSVQSVPPQFVPMGFSQPPPNIFSQPQSQNAEQQLESGIASDSPDSGHVVTPFSLNQRLNGAGGCLQQDSEKWKQPDGVCMVDRAVSPIFGHCQRSQGTQTDCIQIKISASDTEKLISQLLGGIQVHIEFDK